MEKFELKAGCLLIASPSLEEETFRRTVIYLAQHEAQSSVGFVLNRPVNLLLGQVFPEIKQPIPLFRGGPVGTDRLFFLHDLPALIPQSISAGDGHYWAGDLETVRRLLAQGDITGQQIRFFLGYSGWDAGQLETEVGEKHWLVQHPDFDPVAATIPELWTQCLCGDAPAEIFCAENGQEGLPN